MEKAIIKTLIYADIFDYPMTIREIHRWLIKLHTEPRKIEKALKILNYESRVMNYGEYYCLFGRENLVRKRIKKQKQSASFFKKAKMVGLALKIIPWIELVGISGGLSMENAGKKDDIDLFVITQKSRLWISRILILGILDLMGIRRKREDNKLKAAGKICCNIILEEDQLEQTRHDLYTAHEVLQMKVLWERDGIYKKFLEENSWVFKYLPNWISSDRLMIKDLRLKKKNHSLINNHKSAIGLIEEWARKFQLKLMSKPQGAERIQKGALYFHPNDYRIDVSKKYQMRVASLS